MEFSIENICCLYVSIVTVELVMKRHVDITGDKHIKALFWQHESNKIAHCSSPLVVDDDKTGDNVLLLMYVDSAPPIQSDTESEIESKDATPHPPSPQEPSTRSYGACWIDKG
jgi:hypothetical protein